MARALLYLGGEDGKQGRFEQARRARQPRRLPAEVSIFNVQESSAEPCHPEYGGARFACTVLSRGPYRIQVFAGSQTPLPLMAQLEVTGL